MRRVLIIDDSRAMRDALQAALNPYGLEIEAADSGPRGLQKALSGRWDLIFLDIEMPLMDGPTVLRLLRDRGVTTPVVLVTAVSRPQVVAGAIKLGAAHYISKPFTAAQVRAAATRLLHLPPSLLDAPPPRLLLQHTSPALADQVARLLPAHVLLDTSTTLAATLDLAEDGGHGVVLVEWPALLEELVAVASLLRRSLPAAGIFALRHDADPEVPCAPDGELDGVLPPSLELLLPGFLYPNFLRPLLFLDGIVARVAGFQGEPVHQPTYFASLTRTLVARCTSIGAEQDLIIDLASAPADPEALAGLIAGVAAGLRAAGAAPSFRLDPALRAALAARPELAGILFDQGG